MTIKTTIRSSFANIITYQPAILILLLGIVALLVCTVHMLPKCICHLVIRSMSFKVIKE
jgi:hypothetical protein